MNQTIVFLYLIIVISLVLGNTEKQTSTSVNQRTCTPTVHCHQSTTTLESSEATVIIKKCTTHSCHPTPTPVTKKTTKSSLRFRETTKSHRVETSITTAKPATTVLDTFISLSPPTTTTDAVKPTTTILDTFISLSPQITTTTDSTPIAILPTSTEGTSSDQNSNSNADGSDDNDSNGNNDNDDTSGDNNNDNDDSSSDGSSSDDSNSDDSSSDDNSNSDDSSSDDNSNSDDSSSDDSSSNDDTSGDNNNDSDDSNSDDSSNSNSNDSNDNSVTGTNNLPTDSSPTSNTDTPNESNASVFNELPVSNNINNRALGIGLGVGIGCLAALGLAGLLVHNKRKKQGNEEQEVRTRWRPQSFLGVVASVAAKLPRSPSTRSRASEA